MSLSLTNAAYYGPSVIPVHNIRIYEKIRQESSHFSQFCKKKKKKKETEKEKKKICVTDLE